MGRFKQRRPRRERPTEPATGSAGEFAAHPKIYIETIPHSSPETPALCMITWGTEDFGATTEIIRRTATDLHRAAALADVIAELIRKDFPGPVITVLMIDVIGEEAARNWLGHPDTIKIIPGGSTQAREGRVLVERGTMSGALSPDEAREMAQAWFSAAEAAESDGVFHVAMEEAGHFTDRQINDVFAYARALRTDPQYLLDQQREEDQRAAREAATPPAGEP